MNKFNALWIIVCCVTVHAESLQEIQDHAGITELKRSHGLTGKGVNVLVHDGFDDARPGEKSHGHTVHDIIKSGAPGALISDMTSIFVSSKTVDARAGGDIVARFITEKFKPRIVNLSWGQNVATSKVLEHGYEENPQKDLIRELARYGAAVVIAAGNDSLLLGTETDSKEQAEFIDSINNDPAYTGAIILVGAGDVFSPEKRMNDALVKNFMADYSMLAGTSRNHFVVGGPKAIGDASEVDFELVYGTSFTAPIVSSILALLAEKFPEATGKMLIQLLFGGAIDMRTVFERTAVKNHFIATLAETTNLPASHWHNYLRWYDIFGRGVVNAKASYDLGLKTFARKTIFFPHNADMIIFSKSTSYITEANSIWPIFEYWHRQTDKKIDKNTPKSREVAKWLIRKKLWPVMQLLALAKELPFSAENKFNDIAINAAQSGDYDLAYDIFLEGIFYADMLEKKKTDLEFNLKEFSKNIAQGLSKAKKDELIEHALERFKTLHTTFDPQTKWARLLGELRAVK